MASRAGADEPAAEARQAVREVAAGDPGRTARRWLGWLSLVATIAFLVDFYLVSNGLTLSAFDIPVARAVQTFPWGPLTYVMTVTNVTGGLVQDLFGLLVVVLLFAYERRAGMLMALGAVGSLWVELLKLYVSRQRPTADLLSILNPNTGYSFPSGHAVFFTWLSFMLVFSLGPRLSRRLRVLAWTLAGLLVFTACLGRVWAGAHWPADVIGGFLVGIAWCSFVLWVPERWLPTPRFRRRARRDTARA
jgi:membrane-associated phospholipid phosphatase